MQITIDMDRPLPIFQQIVEQLAADIQAGVLPVGTKLPTVRALATQNGLAVGTVRQAYEALQRRGFIVMHQGRGTYVRPIAPTGTPSSSGSPAGRKQQALQAIDRALGEVLALDFSPREARIFLDLRLRELEDSIGPVVKIGIVDCSPEALAQICTQIAPLPNIQATSYLLDDVLADPKVLDPDLNLLVITTNHLSQVTERLPRDIALAAVVMMLSPDTVVTLARVPRSARVGVLCHSTRFSQIALRTSARYSQLDHPPSVLLWKDKAEVTAFLAGIDYLILPSSYESLCPADVLPVIEAHIAAHPHISYHFEMDQGSMLSLTTQLQHVLGTLMG